MGANKAAGLAGGGSIGTLGVFPIGGKASSDFATDMDKLLGLECHDGRGNTYRLVRLNVAAGIAAPGRRVFIYTNLVTNGYDVEMGNAATQRPAGIAHADQVALVDNDYFWLQVEGICSLIHSDDVGAPIAAGDHVTLDNDADKGKVITAATTFTHGVTVARALETTNSNDATFLAQILHKLVG